MDKLDKTIAAVLKPLEVLLEECQGQDSCRNLKLMLPYESTQFKRIVLKKRHFVTLKTVYLLS